MPLERMVLKSGTVRNYYPWIEAEAVRRSLGLSRSSLSKKLGFNPTMWTDWKNRGYVREAIMISLRALERTRLFAPDAVSDLHRYWGFEHIKAGDHKWIEANEAELRRVRRAVFMFAVRNKRQFRTKAFPGGIMIYRAK